MAGSLPLNEATVHQLGAGPSPRPAPPLPRSSSSTKSMPWEAGRHPTPTTRTTAGRSSTAFSRISTGSPGCRACSSSAPATTRRRSTRRCCGRTFSAARFRCRRPGGKRLSGRYATGLMRAGLEPDARAIARLTRAGSGQSAATIDATLRAAGPAPGQHDGSCGSTTWSRRSATVRRSRQPSIASLCTSAATLSSRPRSASVASPASCSSRRAARPGPPAWPIPACSATGTLTSPGRWRAGRPSG